MKEKLIIPKIFTRDFPIVICQVWGMFYKHGLGAGELVFPRQIFVIEDGLASVYRNPKLNSTINDVLIERIGKDKKYLQDFISKAKSQINQLEFVANNKITTREKLLETLDFVLHYWEALFVSLYVPSDHRFEKKDREFAMEFRKLTDKLEYKVFERIGESLNYLYSDLSKYVKFLYLDDIKKSNLPSLDIFKERSKKKIIMIDDQVVSDNEFAVLQKKQNFILESDDTDINQAEIKGTIACPGKVQGKVRKVLRNEDINLFQEGEILVSSMTVPTFLPAMAKAAAFITDEGGITCHAAIVARELRKPCIIGTKIATKVLKDGMEVEVDADAGIVKVLNSK